MNKIKPFVFWPPFLLCAAAVVLNWLDKERFAAVMTHAHGWVTDNFGGFVSWLSLGMLLLCGVIYVSPFGRTTLGGPQAKPLLTKWQMFTVVLTTNIAAGILFWCVYEPVSYLSKPPEGIQPLTPEAAQFAISKVYLNWTVIPYSIASIVGLMFAFAFYNMRKPFSLGAPLSPLLGKHGEGWIGQAIDAICLYSLVAALAAALVGSSMLMAGGIHHIFGIQEAPSPLLLAIIIAAIMGTSVFAAISGVTKGIRHIANLNTAFLIGFLVLILVLGPTRYIVQFAFEGLGQFAGQFFQKALFLGPAGKEEWSRKLTQMLFSAFFAWAPIMGVFLGRIAYGYTVRSFLIFNVLLPALFTGTWMAIICGAAVNMELEGQSHLAAILNPDKPDPAQVLYAFLGQFQFSSILVPILLVTAFLSFVTTADGNTDAMSNISTRGISPEKSESGMLVKIAWGSLMAVFCWMMTGLDGIRKLSDLGGFPAMFLCLAVSLSAIRVLMNPARFDVFHPKHPDYKKTGNENV